MLSRQPHFTTRVGDVAAAQGGTNVQLLQSLNFFS